MEKLSTIQQINSAIMFGNLSNVELNSIVDAVKFARTQLTKQNRRAFNSLTNSICSDSVNASDKKLVAFVPLR